MPINETFILKPENRACLQRIKDKYGAKLKEAADLTGTTEEILAGICMQETRGGESKLLVDISGTPDNPADDVGDHGHGHGLMQIDDRSYPEYILSGKWRDPFESFCMAGRILRDFRKVLTRIITQAVQQELLTPVCLELQFIERATVASYNCGPGNVMKALAAHEDVDARTAGHNYSYCVLAFAGYYKHLTTGEANES